MLTASRARSCASIRANPGRELEAVTVKRRLQVTFRLKQPSRPFSRALASGFSPIYPCQLRGRHPASDRARSVSSSSSSSPTSTSGHAQPRLLEEGPGLISRHRVYDHQEPVTGRIGVGFRESSTWLPYSSRSRLEDVKNQMPQALCEMGPVGLNRACSSPGQTAVRQPDLRRRWR